MAEQKQSRQQQSARRSSQHHHPLRSARESERAQARAGAEMRQRCARGLTCGRGGCSCDSCVSVLFLAELAGPYGPPAHAQAEKERYRRGCEYLWPLRFPSRRPIRAMLS